MSTKYHKFTGKSYYARVFGKGDEEYKNWKIGVVLDPESQKEFDDSGLQLRSKKTTDGEYYYDFRRPHEKVFPKTGLTTFEAPEVTDRQGNVVTESIGNGSIVTITVSAYDTRRGKGHRLEKVTVDKLIPYEKPQPSADNSSLPPV
jgi:hypothetical protein